MSNKQAWEDFNRVIREFGRIQESITDVSRWAGNLQTIKTEIFDDVDRKSELKKIIDIHPDYTITGVVAMYQKLQVLKTYLIDNGYVIKEEEG